MVTGSPVAMSDALVVRSQVLRLTVSQLMNVITTAAAVIDDMAELEINWALGHKGTRTMGRRLCRTRNRACGLTGGSRQTQASPMVEGLRGRTTN